MIDRRQRFMRFQSCQSRRAFTVLELLVTTGVVGMLAGLLLPAVHQARETARQIQCQNNLKQIGLALHNYHDVQRSLPIGAGSDALAVTSYGWATAILPYLDQAPLATLVHDRVELTSPANDEARQEAPSEFLCPSDHRQPLFTLIAEAAEHHAFSNEPVSELTLLPSTNYIGVFGVSDVDDIPGDEGEGAFVQDCSFQFRDLTRGLTQVAIVGERTARKLPSTWIGTVMAGEDGIARLLGNNWLGPNRDDADECEFDSRHPGCTHFLFGDGHVKAVPEAIDTTAYREMAMRW